MKLSVSLTDADVRFLDEYAAQHGASRSAAVARAVALLRASQLTAEYVVAFDEWSDADPWDRTTADGLD